MIVVVEDEPAARRALTRLIGDLYETRIAGSLTEAQSVLREKPRWTAVFVDIALPEGRSAGLSVIEEAVSRTSHVFVLSGEDPARLTVVRERGLSFLPKPASPRSIEDVLFELEASALWWPESEEIAFARATDHYALTANEAAIVRWIHAGREVVGFAEQMELPVETVEADVAALLAKTSARSVWGFTRRVARAVRPPTS